MLLDPLSTEQKYLDGLSRLLPLPSMSTKCLLAA